MNKLVKDTTKKNVALKKNRMLKEKVSAMQDKLIKRNETMQLLTEESKELKMQIELCFTEEEINTKVIRREWDKHNKLTWPLFIVKIIY